ncbi:MAG: hypothetical protein JSS89_05185 [Bacteroidetes bacterium]|nr:hypothetical protein [Bacteroidota bacterium]
MPPHQDGSFADAGSQVDDQKACGGTTEHVEPAQEAQDATRLCTPNVRSSARFSEDGGSAYNT